MKIAVFLQKSLVLFCGIALLSACGGGGSGEATRSLGGTNAPQIAAVQPQTVAPGETLSFTVTATDPDGDPVTLAVQGLPAGAAFDPASGAFSWTPGPDAAGIHYLGISAADRSGSSARTVQISVIPTTLPEAPAGSGGTIFGQTIPPLDFDFGIFPGQANFWDLDTDFALVSGGDGQFEDGGALILTLGDGAVNDAVDFPLDQTYGELTWGGPLFTQADGVRTAAVASGQEFILPPLAGNFSALLNGTTDSRLQQTVDLTGVPAGAPLSLTWKSDHLLVPNFPGEPLRYELVIRALDGTELQRLDLDPLDAPAQLDLSPYAGRKIEISFEAFNTNYGFIQLDEVSLLDGSGGELLVNGNFETGDLRGWRTPLALEPQNVTSAPRSLSGTVTPFNVRVTRSFYTAPNKLWGRWVDTIENTGTEAIVDLPVAYTVLLGAHLPEDSTGNLPGTAVIYPTPGTEESALSIWDARELIRRTQNKTELAGSRDVGLVFGTQIPLFESLTDLQAVDGSPDVVFADLVSLAPGEKVAMVNFVVMAGRDTGETAADLSARSAVIDKANQEIVRDFWTDPQYRVGIPQDLIDNDRLWNWPRP